MVLHGGRVGLVVKKHRPVRVDQGDAVGGVGNRVQVLLARELHRLAHKLGLLPHLRFHAGV